MKLNLYQINAFTDEIFGGNPACVVPLQSWLPDKLMLSIAKENAVAETAFFILDTPTIKLRWFTPEIEMDLCGHATLATAHCLKTIMGFEPDEMIFSTQSGALKVHCENDLYFLDLPSRKPLPAELPEIITRSLNIQPKEVWKSRDYMLVYDSESEIRALKTDKVMFDQINLDPGGVIVTARGKECDFVSRFFTPQSSIPEDPVTGSAHCTLIPYWSELLKKDELLALQISERIGKLSCRNAGNRVVVGGNARTYFVGECWI
jgi:PhzF family phenazine biosynthesis protein